MGQGSGFFKFRPLHVDLGDALVQVVAVALGVILGFAVTSWNDREHQRGLLRDTVGNIASELRSNQAGMSLVTTQHARSEAILEQLVARSAKARSISLDEVETALRESGDMRVNVPLGIAWQIAQSDQGLALLPYDDRYDLAWIYELQAVYYQEEERYENSLLTLTQSPNGNYYFQTVNLAKQLRSVVQTERQLNGLYAQAMTRARSEFHL